MSTRTKDRTEDCKYDYGNPHAQNTGVGGYTHSQYIVHDNNRGSCNETEGLITNVYAHNKGHKIVDAPPRMTTKETTSVNNYLGHASSQAKGIYIKDINYTQDNTYESRSYVPGPQSANVLQDASAIIGNVIGNDDGNNNERLEPLKASGIQNHTTSVSFGTVMDRNLSLIHI